MTATAGRAAICVALALVSAGSAISGRRTRSPAEGLTPGDYYAIKSTLARYVVGWDNSARDDQGAMVAAAFTPDVVMANFQGVRVGNVSVADSAIRFSPGLQHWPANFVIEPAGPGRAKSWSYVLLVTVDDDGRRPRITGGGVYRDELEKNSRGEWLIRRRTFEAVTSGEPASWPWDRPKNRWDGVRPARTLALGEVRLAVTDPEAAARWYRSHAGARPVDRGAEVLLGRVRLVFDKVALPRASAGTVFDHLAVSARDPEATVRGMVGDGARLVRPVTDVAGAFEAGMVEDPWGIRVEVVRDSFDSGLHHVHLMAGEPERTLRWYVGTFGGETARLGRLEGVRYGPYGNWILVEEGRGAPSANGAIGRVGWRGTEMRRTAERVAAQTGKRLVRQPSAVRDPAAWTFEGLNGDAVSLIQER